MQPISVTEKKLIEEIINLGYQHAATSFSSLTGQNIRTANTAYEICTDHDYLMDNFDHLKNLTIVQTDIMGQLKGSSYLIFNEEEKRVVTHMSLDTFGSSVFLDECAILKEIDNIISAAVITELSNALNVSIYGDVPQLLELDNIEEFHSLMNEGNSDYHVLVSANFIFDGHSCISPVFIWKIDKKIMSMIIA